MPGRHRKYSHTNHLVALCRWLFQRPAPEPERDRWDAAWIIEANRRGTHEHPDHSATSGSDHDDNDE